MHGPSIRRGLATGVAAALIVAGCAGASSPHGTPLSSSTQTTAPITTTTLDDSSCRFGEVPSTGGTPDRGDETGWVIADPAEPGIDIASFEKALDQLEELKGVRSFLVVRHGKLVVERYFHGGNATQSREIASASKSVVSALVGIAIDRGYITGVNQTLDSLLPESFVNGAHGDKASLTLRSLLTMTTGFAYEPIIVGRQSRRDSVSVENILSAPLSSPKSSFLYNTGGVHLASAILTRATGMSTCMFATKYLFGPAGVTVDWWNQDRDGIFTGGWNMYLTPRELARFGQLYLDNGVRNGQQVISADWIHESFIPRLSQVAGPVTDYGYWWWISQLNGMSVYSARGGGEQMVYVIPSLDMVVVTTSDTDIPVDERLDSLTFLWQYLLPSVTP
ncbi:MAG: serine hydrolase [Acidimicrobiia bacterium]